MSSPKPTLGYATRTEAVHALRTAGLTTRAIAAKIGIETSTVTALEASAARKSKPRTEWHGARSTALQHTVAIDNDTLIALRPHAARRNTTVNRLVRDLINIIADDGLVNALLDDEAEIAR